MQKIINIFIGFCLALALAACASTTQARELSDLPEFTGSEYELGPQDELRVNVFGEPDLSGEFVIASNGKVSLPLIGEVTAAGLTVTEFQNKTQDLLRDGYLIDP